MNKRNISFLGITGLLILVVAISGCTSSKNTKTYENSNMGFEYPSDWTIVNETDNFILFNSSEGITVRLALYTTENSPINIDKFTENYTEGNNEYVLLRTNIEGMGLVYSYVIRKNGKDLNIICGDSNRDGVKTILRTFQFK